MEIKALNDNPYYDLQLKFRYQPDLVARCNKLSKELTWKKFRYDSNLQSWLFNIEDFDKVLKAFPGTDVPTEVYDNFIDTKNKRNKIESERKEVKHTPIETDLPLYDYQKIGVNFIINNKKCALFDQVRLGKLYQSAGAIYHLKPERVLVICPNTTKINWQRKVKELINWDAYIVDDQFVEGINIIHFEALQKFAMKSDVVKRGKKVEEWTWLDSTKWDMIIVDESHKIKGGKKTIRGSLVELVCKQGERVIILTATPMPTNVKDLVPQLKIIDKLDEFGGEWDFLQRYCGAKKTRFGWDFRGATHLDELNEKLQVFSLRRLFKDVWKDIPPMTENATYLDLPEPIEYSKALNKLNQELIQASEHYKATYKRLAGKNKIERAEVLLALKDDPNYKKLTSLAIVKIEKLKQEIVRQKLILLPEILEEYMESKTKVVVFAIHKAVVKKLAALYPDNSIYITGETEIEDRTKYLDKFMTNPNTYFAFTTMATSQEGLDFSVANYVIHTELDWTPDNHVQASGRIINTEKKTPTNSNYIVMNNTIEDDIIETLLNKSKNIEKVIGGNALTKVLSKVLSDLPF